MPCEARIVRDVHASNNETPAGLETMQVVSSSDSWNAQVGLDGSLRVVQQSLRHVKIVWRRDFDVRRFAIDEPHRMAGFLRERCLIGGQANRLAAACESILEHSTAERLRCLRQIN